MRKNILIVDDEPVQLKLLEKFIGDLDHNVILMTNGRQVVDFFVDKKPINGIKHNEINIMFLDLQIPEVDGMSVLKQIAGVRENLQVIVLSASADSITIINALNSGANDYIIKGEKDLLARVFSSVNNSIEKQNLKQQVSYLEHKDNNHISFSSLIGNSKDFISAINLAKKAANSNVPVLISGDFGVGKELLARAIHGSSARAGMPFIVIDCNYLKYSDLKYSDLKHSDLDQNTADIILFGSERSEVYGIQTRSVGKIREADGGTIFLDNVSCLRDDMQVKLLRFIQEGIIEPIGSKLAVKISARVISSTVKDLNSYVKCNRFKEDLYYRLNILRINMPTLLNRGDEDIKLLAENFCRDYSISENKKIKGLTEQSLELLYKFNWEGNIRQLKSYIFRAVMLCDGWILKPEHFPRIADIVLEYETKKKPTDYNKISQSINLIHHNGGCKDLEEIETEVIEKYLDLFKGNLSEVSKQLKVGRSTIYRKLK
jgi:DNA-binding NtrC family response regulator